MTKEQTKERFMGHVFVSLWLKQTIIALLCSHFLSRAPDVPYRKLRAHIYFYEIQNSLKYLNFDVD